MSRITLLFWLSISIWISIFPAFQQGPIANAVGASDRVYLHFGNCHVESERCGPWTVYSCQGIYDSSLHVQEYFVSTGFLSRGCGHVMCSPSSANFTFLTNKHISEIKKFFVWPIPLEVSNASIHVHTALVTDKLILWFNDCKFTCSAINTNFKIKRYMCVHKPDCPVSMHDLYIQCACTRQLVGLQWTLKTAEIDIVK